LTSPRRPKSLREGPSPDTKEFWRS